MTALRFSLLARGGPSGLLSPDREHVRHGALYEGPVLRWFSNVVGEVRRYAAERVVITKRSKEVPKQGDHALQGDNPLGAFD